MAEKGQKNCSRFLCNLPTTSQPTPFLRIITNKPHSLNDKQLISVPHRPSCNLTPPNIHRKNHIILAELQTRCFPRIQIIRHHAPVLYPSCSLPMPTRPAAHKRWAVRSKQRAAEISRGLMGALRLSGVRRNTRKTRSMTLCSRHQTQRPKPATDKSTYWLFAE